VIRTPDANGSYGQRANGFRPGDLIMEVDGRPARDVRAVQQAARGSQVVLQRQGRRLAGSVR
jgi:C-terminal processing protease CtpA/Prc